MTDHPCRSMIWWGAREVGGADGDTAAPRLQGAASGRRPPARAVHRPGPTTAAQHRGGGQPGHATGPAPQDATRGQLPSATTQLVGRRLLVATYCRSCTSGVPVTANGDVTWAVV